MVNFEDDPFLKTEIVAYYKEIQLHQLLKYSSFHHTLTNCICAYLTHTLHWHEVSQPSTLTTDIAKLRLTDKPKIQIGLEFDDSITPQKYRKRRIYQSIKHTVVVTYRKLYAKYLLTVSEEEEIISMGTFVALKLFYISSANVKDLQCVYVKSTSIHDG
jgi:hypothetical protein